VINKNSVLSITAKYLNLLQKLVLNAQSILNTPQKTNYKTYSMRVAILLKVAIPPHFL
jgi:hypothetical protein